MGREIMNKLEKINYRFITDDDFVYSASEVLKNNSGNCWEQVELERKLFADYGIDTQTYFVSMSDETGKYQTHTFLVYIKNEKYCWFEHAWEEYVGIHEYLSLEDLLKDVKRKLLISFSGVGEVYCFVYLYPQCNKRMNAIAFLEYAQSGTLIKLNEPLYFYHLVNKLANLDIGILSLKYFYDNEMYKEFDEYAEKYKRRIVNDWGIEKFKDTPEELLSREDILDALKIFRGDNGASYIYFFRFPPYSELGQNMKEILKNKDIYCINLNDEELQLQIKDIFYGYENIHSDNKKLDKSYYENVTKEEYFSSYEDNVSMNYAKLNHISIAFKYDYCPANLIKKC